MSDKTMGIAVQMSIDDVTSGLNDLLGLFNQIPDSITTDINLGGDAEGGLTNVSTELDTINNTQLAIPVDDSSITTLEGDASTASSNISGMGDAAESASSVIQDAMTAADDTINNLGSDASSAGSNISDMGSGAGTDTGGSTSGGGFAGDLGATVGGIIGLSTLTEAQNVLYDTNISIDKISTQTGIATAKMTDLIYAMTDAHFSPTDAENYIEVLSQLGVPNELLAENAKALNEVQIGTGATAESTIQFAADIEAMGGDINNLSQYYGMAQYVQDNVKGGMNAFATEAKMLGPRLKDMGFTAEESAVIIADLSKKNAGNIRGMRKDLTDAHGSASNLMNILGTTKGEVDQTSSSFTGLSGSSGESAEKLKHHADVTRANTTATQQVTDATNHAALATSSWSGDLLRAIIPLGGLTVGIGIASRALSRLKPEMSPSLWDVYIKMWRDVGEKVVSTIKGWLPNWSSEAGKSAQGTFKALESGIKSGSDSFTTKVKDFGGKITDTIKGWKPSWEGASKDVDMVKGADGTYNMKAPAFLDKVRGYGNQIGDAIRGWKFPKPNLTFLNDIGTGITSKLPSIKGIGGRIPASVTEGITSKLPTLLGKAGGPAMIVTTVLQGLSGAGENWHKNVIQQTKEAFGIDMWQGVVWSMFPDSIKGFVADRSRVFLIPFDSAVKFLGLDRLNISPEEFWGAIFGKDAAKRFGDWLDTNVSGPINHWFLGLGDWFKSLPGKTYDWGKGIIDGLGKGISDAIPGLTDVLKEIGDLFPHSPPKSGPLANIKASEMESWMGGIASAGMKGIGKFNLGNIGVPSMPNMPNGIGMGSASPVMHLEVHPGAVQINGNADKSVIENAGNILGESTANKLHQELINKGYSAYNRSR